MRACAQCGLSIVETATFCAVCGAQGDALLGPPAFEASGAAPATGEGAVAPSPYVVAAPSPAAASAPDAAAGAATAAGDQAEGLESRLARISRSLRDADRCERDDAPRAAEIYRTAIIAYLEATDDPLGSEEARRGLLRSFDRLSLVLQRAGLTAEALEQIELADSLGLLACRDERTEGYREALRRRRKSLGEAETVAAAASF